MQFDDANDNERCNDIKCRNALIIALFFFNTENGSRNDGSFQLLIYLFFFFRDK